MKTKIGEVKKTEDFFETIQVKNSEWFVKCKICGDIVSEKLMWLGAFNEMEKHLELHKINGLETNQNAKRK